MIVSGTGVYKAEDMALAISTMKRSVEQYGCSLHEGLSRLFEASLERLFSW